MKKTTKRIGLALALVMVVSMLFTGCSSSKSVTIGSKDYGENIVLGEIFSQLIEAKTDIKVNRKLNMGGTFVCFEAIKNGDIDIYPEFTGTALTALLKADVISDPDEAYEFVSNEFDKQFNIKWFKDLGYNNTYAIAISNEAYEKYGVETNSDFAKISEDFVFGAEHEFFDRQDGYDGLVAEYGITFKGEPKRMNVALKYQAIGNGEVDATIAYTTDGALKQYDLKILEDDKGFFPPYYVAPIIRKETLEKYPELEQVLNLLGGQVDEETMTGLNYKIDVEGIAIETVAKDFLESKGFLD
jgi:osmoprotectant transport system substrate-binding protein